MASTNIRPQSSVTLLHKGHGPSLFQYQSQLIPGQGYSDLLKGPPSKAGQQGPPSPSSLPPTPRSQNGGKSRKLKPPPPIKPPPKRIIVKCVERQDENSMFAKRLEARQARHYRPSSSSGTFIKRSPAQNQQCELYLKERLFTNSPQKPSSFPPPSFMPRWNPRRQDRTYLSKMVLDDPWSLPPDKRLELQKKTGLRLKSISKHYQYKVGGNLPFGKDADAKCNCFVDFCDHCSKKYHDNRCPLHLQLLDRFEPDCKQDIGEFCPFSKNVEDLPLNLIQDPGVYVTEVVRRLKQGEIKDVPPFPARFLKKVDIQSDNQKKILASAEASNEALDYHDRKAPREDAITQTEPFIVDVDNKAAYKENTSQTRPPDKEEPVIMTSILRSSGHYKPCAPHSDMSTQVTPCVIQTFNERSSKVVQEIAKQILGQALQEISNEMRLQQIQRIRAHYTQRLVDLQRTCQFKYLEEKWRNNAYQEEQILVEQEEVLERYGEVAVTAVGFCMSYLWNFPGKVLEGLRREGFVVNEDLQAIRGELRDDLNKEMEERLRRRDDSIKILDEMIGHAILDLEMDAFRAKMVDEKYLDPLSISTRFLREMIIMRDNNFEMIRRIRARLLKLGWIIGEDGELIRGTPTPSATSSDESLDAFLKGVRVSIDSQGHPKYLVDFKGKRLPINVRWMPVLQEQVEEHLRGGDKDWRFDIVLDEKSLSDTQLSSMEVGQGGIQGRQSKWGNGRESRGDDVGEGMGLDLDYLGSERSEDDSEDDDEDDKGRLVFKRKDMGEIDDDDEFLEESGRMQREEGDDGDDEEDEGGVEVVED